MDLEIELRAYPIGDPDIEREILVHNRKKFLLRHAQGASNDEFESMIRFEHARTIKDISAASFGYEFIDDEECYRDVVEEDDIWGMRYDDSVRIETTHAAMQYIKENSEVEPLSEKAQAYYETITSGRDGYNAFGFIRKESRLSRFDFDWEDANHINRWFHRRLKKFSGRFSSYKYFDNPSMLSLSSGVRCDNAYRNICRDDMVELRRVLDLAIELYETYGEEEVAQHIFLRETLPMTNDGYNEYDDAYHQVNILTRDHVNLIIDEFDFENDLLKYDHRRNLDFYTKPGVMRVVEKKTDDSASDAVKL